MLSLTIGENGIIKKATQSGVAYEEAKAREKLELVLLDMQAEKRTNSEYNKEEYLTKKIEEQGMTVNEDIVLVDGWKFSIDRDIPQIGESLGKGSTNEKIKLQLSQTVSSDYVKSTIKVEIEYEGEITSIKIGGENIEPIPEKKDGKYVIEKEIEENGVVSVVVEDEEKRNQIRSIKVSNLTEDMDIWTKEDLELFRDRVNSGRTYEKRIVKVMADIDLNYGKYTVSQDGTVDFSSDAIQWEPISKYEEGKTSYFKGLFDGTGKTIKGLYIDNVNDYQGLFACNNGNIKNLILDNVNITGRHSIGILVGNNKKEGTLFNIKINGIIHGKESSIGGVCGSNGGNIIQCVNSSKVSTSFGEHIGGICGYNGGNIIQCYNKGNVVGERWVVGGICGHSNNNGKIEKCYNTGNILSSYYACGGIVGDNYGKVEYVYNLGNIKAMGQTGGGYTNVAGIAGYNWGDISYSYSIAEINSATSAGYGLLIGQQFDGANIKYSYATPYNNRELIGYYKGGTSSYNETISSTIISNWEEDTIVKKLTNNFIKDTNNINNGYPILKWQTEN